MENTSQPQPPPLPLRVPPPIVPPPGFGPAPLEYYPGKPASRIPTCVKVLSIIGIVTSSLAILSVSINLINVIRQSSIPGNPVEAMMRDPVMRLQQWIGLPMGFLFSLAHLILCIAALKLVRWARKGMVIYAAGNMAVGVISAVFFFAYSGPRMVRLMNGTTGMNQTALTIGMVASIISIAVNLLYMLILHYYFTRPHVKEAFDAQPRVSGG